LRAIVRFDVRSSLRHRRAHSDYVVCTPCGRRDAIACGRKSISAPIATESRPCAPKLSAIHYPAFLVRVIARIRWHDCCGRSRVFIIRHRAAMAGVRKLRSLGDSLPIGSNRPQNPPAAGTLNSPARRSNVEAVQRCARRLPERLRGPRPHPVAPRWKQPFSCHWFRRGKARPGWDAWAPKRSLKGEQKRSRPARDLAGKSQIGLV
jgi:hypothetical protein